MASNSRTRIWIGGFLCGVIAIAAVAMVVRTFFVQGLLAKVETSSGSMAPWLLGPHGDAQCDVCEMTFVFDAAAPPRRERLDCPNCRQRTAQRRTTEVFPGQQVLIDRRAFARRSPRRWEPVVFQCPEEIGALCIKRVVGLPGEAIEIRDGDILADGRIARKTLAKQREVAIALHDSRWRMADAGVARPGWIADEKGRGWQLARGHFHYEDADATAMETPNAIRFHNVLRGVPQPISDDYGYNQNVSRELNATQDIMLEFGLTAHGTGMLQVEAVAHGHLWTVILHDQTGQVAKLLRDGKPIATNRPPPLLGSPAQITVSLFDRQMLVAINGETLLQADAKTTRDTPQQQPPSPSIAIKARSIVADVWHVRLSRDIYYTRPRTARWGFDEPLRLNQQEYFVLGDNSPISMDSRSWESPGIASKQMVGKPLHVRP